MYDDPSRYFAKPLIIISNDGDYVSPEIESMINYFCSQKSFNSFEELQNLVDDSLKQLPSKEMNLRHSVGNRKYVQAP